MSKLNKTAQALFEQQVETFPDHTAIVYENKDFSYQELNTQANQLAHYLREKGVKPDDLIGVCLERSPELLIAILAILKAGGAYVPLDPSHSQERLQLLLEDGHVAILITESNLREKFSHFAGELFFFGLQQESIKTYSSQNPLEVNHPGHLAYVIYTSGSTGKPKGVLIEHHSLVNYVEWLADYTACRYPWRLDFSANIIFDMAVTTSIAPLMLGQTLVICPEAVKQDVAAYLNYLTDQRINCIKITPGYFKILLQEARQRRLALTSLQMIILGGENLPPEDCAQWLESYPSHVLINEYGPTEATVAVSHYRISQANVRQLAGSVPIGKPGQGMFCYVLDADKQPVPVGAMGELYIGGLCLARGYLNNETLTQQQFSQDRLSKEPGAKIYKTGDLARLLPDGNLVCLGRSDDQVKIRGYRIEPGEIESRLKAHAEIQDALVVPFANEAQGELRLAAYCIPRQPGLTLDHDHLRAHLQAYLPDYMVPAYFMQLSSFPLTPNGKIDKKALPSPHARMAENYLPPRTEIEQSMAGIWAKELNQKRVGIKDNFFELGGTSLSAARIMSAIKNKFWKDIPLDSLYRHPTIEQLTGFINNKHDAKQAYGHRLQELMNSSGVFPLGEFQFMYWVANIFEPKTKKLNILRRKRVSGKIELAFLERAFHSLFEQQEVMVYRPSKWFPVQYLKKNLRLKIFEENIQHFEKEQAEKHLLDSLRQFTQHHAWKKGSPLILVKLFYLRDGSTELQVCLSHSISDDASGEILFSALSDCYLAHQNNSPIAPSNNIPFKEYVNREWNTIFTNLDKDLKFWESYLQDADLFAFPAEQVVKDMKSPGIPYSSYFELSEAWRAKLQMTCREHQLGILDLLCALLGSALTDYQRENKKVFVNIIKSTRDEEGYDKSIGCFLRLDPIKMDISNKPGLIDLAKQIQQSFLETLDYQACPGILKLACLLHAETKPSVMANQLMALACKAYTKISSNIKVNTKILIMYLRLIFNRRKPRFILNVNVWNNFLSEPEDPGLFGFPAKEVSFHQYDLSTIDHLLEFCFLKDEKQQKSYLVLSGNLTPAFREILGKKIIASLS